MARGADGSAEICQALVFSSWYMVYCYRGRLENAMILRGISAFRRGQH